MMERYLLFDSGCSKCSQIAQEVEQAAQGWLKARSLRDLGVQQLLDRARPEWRWEPTLLEVELENVRVFTGVAMSTKIGLALGPQRAWRILRVAYGLKVQSDVNMERRHFLKESGMVMAGLAMLGLPSAWTHKPKALSLSAEGWSQYIDPQYGFAIEYPSNWELLIPIQQPIPATFDSAIIKRLRLPLAGFGLIDLDIWLSKGLDLSAWIQDYITTRPQEGLTSTPNAKIAGQPAVVFHQPSNIVDMMFAYFRYGDYVYRLSHMKPEDYAPLEAYWHMLDTFTLPGVASAAAYIPSDLRNQPGRSAPISSLQANNCCTYTCTNNPFPCCTAGNCTWWVYYKYCSHGGVPFTGNASYWWDQVPDHAYQYWSRQTGSPPTTHPSIPWWGTWFSPTGHVAYVASYSGGNTVHTTEMDCVGAFCARDKDRQITEPGGYIFNYYF